jgi:hypothetical protein
MVSNQDNSGTEGDGDVVGLDATVLTCLSAVLSRNVLPTPFLVT